MTRSRALAPLAPLVLALVAMACHSVDLGHDGQGGDTAAGGGVGTGGSDQAAGGGVDSGAGGDQAGTGGATDTGAGGQSAGTGGAAAFACPTALLGALSTFSRAPYEPQGVAVDASAIYWTAAAQGIHAGAVLRTDLASGSTVELATAALDAALPATSFDYPAGLALAAGDVVWSAGAGGEVVKVPQAGGAATTLYHDGAAHVAGTGTSPHTFTADATNVYWVNVTRVGDLVTNALLAAPLTGAGPLTSLGSTTVNINDAQAPPWMATSLRVDGATAFYALLGPGNAASVTRSVGVDGQNTVDLLQAGIFLAVDGADLYTALDDVVISMTEAGANQVVVPGSDSNQVIDSYQMIATYQAVALHGGDVYLTSYGSASDGQSLAQGCGWVTKVPKAGGNATVIWAGKGRPYDIAVDDASVTWSDADNQSVMRVVP